MTSKSPSSRTFRLDGTTEVHRLGFGAMQITGRGIWGPPADVPEALATLRSLPGLGVDFIDTADAYGPNFSEELIKTALHPYPGILVATKGGLVRSGPDLWTPLGRPEYLIQQAYASRARLGVEQIGLWQLHRIDPSVPRDEQFSAIKTLIDAKVIKHAGLSQISVDDIQAASRYFKVATVQNRFNLIDRGSESVLDYCTNNGIGFIPWYPLASGSLAKSGSLLDEISARRQATPAQIALAWLLQRSPVMLPIPGTSKVLHAKQNMAAAAIELTAAEFDGLNIAGPQG